MEREADGNKKGREFTGAKSIRENLENSLRKKKYNEIFSKTRMMYMHSKGDQLDVTKVHQDLKQIEEGFRDFKGFTEQSRLTQAGESVERSMRYFSDQETEDDSTRQAVFELAYKHAYFGCCRVYLAQARPSEALNAIGWLKVMAQASNEAIIMEMISTKVHETLMEFILRADVSRDNEQVVGKAYATLACLVSDCLPAIKDISDGPYIEKIMERGVQWAQNSDVRQGFFQFICGMVSEKCFSFKAHVKTTHFDMAIDILKNRQGDDKTNSITDAFSLIEFMTDHKDGDDERPFVSAMLYLLDKGLYEICFEGLADDSIATRLRVLCARCIGNVMSLSEDQANLETVKSIEQKILSIPNCLNVCANVVVSNQAPTLVQEVIWILSNMTASRGGKEVAYQLSQNKELMEHIIVQLVDGVNLGVN